MDIAVLKMETKDKFTPVSFGDSDKARVGDWAVAIGNPFGLGGTVTAGIISARNRDINLTRYDDFIQTDASINQGNSGGPLFNLKGEVIGINTAIIAPGQSGSIGIGFAIPANAASNVIDQLMEFGETKRGWLGVRIQEVTKEIADVEKLKRPEGALVASVGENSPADKAGIKAGDIILEFDGKKIDTMRTLPKVVANTKVGKSVQLKIWRNKKLITKRLTLGRLESSEEFKEKKSQTVPKDIEIDVLKITVRDLTEQDIKSRNLKEGSTGVVIVDIANRSPLINLLSVDDVIIEVQKKSVKDTSDLNKIVSDIFKKGEKTLLLTVINKNNQRNYLGVKIN
jgi:serine protease Do